VARLKLNPQRRKDIRLKKRNFICQSTTTGKQIVTYKGYNSRIWAKEWDEGLQITWAPDSKRIAISFNKTIQVRDTSTDKVLLGFDGHSKLITAVTWSPDGNFIASASKDGTVQIWNATTGNHVTAFSARKRHAVKDVAWAPDSKRIAFCSPRFISTLLYIGSVS
jgi:WD40 repeat protein